MPAAFSISIQRPDFQHNVIAISQRPSAISHQLTTDD
jgi:hypothetical protein